MTAPRNIRVFTVPSPDESPAQPVAIDAAHVIAYGPVAGGAGGAWLHMSSGGQLKIQEKFSEVHTWLNAQRVHEAPDPAAALVEYADKHPIGIAWAKPAKVKLKNVKVGKRK